MKKSICFERPLMLPGGGAFIFCFYFLFQIFCEADDFQILLGLFAPRSINYNLIIGLFNVEGIYNAADDSEHVL